MSDELNDNDEGENSYQLAVPFFIDTDGYTDRDREMFCCGAEFRQFYEASKTGERYEATISRENMTRFRLASAFLDRRCELTTPDDWDESARSEWCQFVLHESTNPSESG